MIPLEYETNEETGEDAQQLPPQCTLQQPPDGIYYPVWTGTKWIKTVEVPPKQPEPGPSEMDKLKTELEVTKAAMAEFIMQQTLKGMGM
ncbi:hypothetical protein ACQKD6_23640 [Bacillus cereus]|uniref:hypothetical protein n=1 Tax=Bacillus cereus TaxID=1396 RepID=UPI003CFC1064